MPSKESLRRCCHLKVALVPNNGWHFRDFGVRECSRADGFEARIGGLSDAGEVLAHVETFAVDRFDAVGERKRWNGGVGECQASNVG